MTFYITLAALNLACFMPLYVLNFRDYPNPFEIVRHARSAPGIRAKLRWLYTRPRSTDPFRINFDFTFIVLLAAATGYNADWIIFCSALLLAFGFVEILYTTVMQSVFKRAPAFVSDLSLVRSGLTIAQGHAYWIVPAVPGLLVGIAWTAFAATELLFSVRPRAALLHAGLAFALVPAAFYHGLSYGYSEFLSRTVYSPLLHAWRNWAYSRRVREVLSKPASYFERHNHFRQIELDAAPTVIVLCVESYGSIVFRDASYASGLQPMLRGYEAALGGRGYGMCSAYSAAPIFAGGSWLSYASFTYGAPIDDGQLFDGLFSHASAFAAYESLFHVLKRSGYRNVLLCPLQGVDTRSIDWRMIERCFQCDERVDFDALGYEGPCVSYLGVIGRHAPPDQFSLNAAYESAKRGASGPFSLFFCTLNSHLPWDSPVEAVTDWRGLNVPGAMIETAGARAPASEKYGSAIRYQLDYILRFVVKRADDDLLVVIFGDHQPPLLTAEHLGTETPVHVIGRNRNLMRVLEAHGFAPGLDLASEPAATIRHEGFLSLFLKAMNEAYGRNSEAEIEYRERGVALFDTLEPPAPGRPP